MTNDDTLESSHQGEFIFGLLAGNRHNCKNNKLVQGKQTVAIISMVGTQKNKSNKFQKEMERDNNDVAQDGVEPAASLLRGGGCLAK